MAVPTSLAIEVPSRPASLPRVRAAVGAWAADTAPSRRASLVLVVSELVGNSVRHGCGNPVTLDLELREDGIHGAVDDRGSAEVAVDSEPGAHGGFGLHIVTSLTDRWGVADGSSRVWFVL